MTLLKFSDDSALKRICWCILHILRNEEERVVISSRCLDVRGSRHTFARTASVPCMCSQPTSHLKVNARGPGPGFVGPEV